MTKVVHGLQLFLDIHRDVAVYTVFLCPLCYISKTVNYKCIKYKKLHPVITLCISRRSKTANMTNFDCTV